MKEKNLGRKQEQVKWKGNGRRADKEKLAGDKTNL